MRITESKKNSMKIENHISVHSNLNLNGLIAQDSETHKPKGIGKEVNNELECKMFFEFIFFLILLSIPYVLISSVSKHSE